MVKVFKPVRGQLNWETEFPSPRLRSKILSRDTGSAVPSHISPFILHAQTVLYYTLMSYLACFTKGAFPCILP